MVSKVGGVLKKIFFWWLKRDKVEVQIVSILIEGRVCINMVIKGVVGVSIIITTNHFGKRIRLMMILFK